MGKRLLAAAIYGNYHEPLGRWPRAVAITRGKQWTTNYHKWLYLWIFTSNLWTFMLKFKAITWTSALYLQTINAGAVRRHLLFR